MLGFDGLPRNVEAVVVGNMSEVYPVMTFGRNLAKKPYLVIASRK